MPSRSGFTLIELLVVIAVIAVLAVVAVLTLNPAGLLQESRDSNRLSDMATLNSAIGLSLADNPSESLGSPNVLYASVPDPAATSTLGDQCQGLGMPSLPASYSWHCAASSTYRKTDGTGWVPVNLSQNTFGSSLGQLPADPANATSSRLFYAYATDGSGRYEAATPFESQKFRLGGSGDQISGDGGTLSTVYERGSKLGLIPLDYGDPSLVGYWTFDEGAGTVAYDYSGSNATGSWNGTLGNQWAAGRVGGGAGAFDGSTNRVNAGNGGNLNTANAVTVGAWVKFNGLDYVGNTGKLFDIGNKGNPDTAPGIPSFGWRFSYDNRNNGSGFTYTCFGNSGGGFAGGGNNFPQSYIFSNNIWYNIVFTIDPSSQAKLYVNGVQLGSTRTFTNLALSNTTDNLNIGNIGSPFNGLIDDVRLYNRALSSAEIQALYNGGK